MSQSPDNSNLVRLRQLVAAKCNGSLSPAELDQLQALLSSSKQARIAYWEDIAVHADLEWELAGKEGCDDALARLLMEGGCSTVDRTPRHKSGVFKTMAWSSAVAACLVGVLFGGWKLWNSDRGDPSATHAESGPRPAEVSPIIGRLTSLVADSRWSFGRPGDRNPENFHLGDTIWIDQGAVEMRLSDETVAQLEAPVIMQLLSLDRVRVLSGRIKVNVPKGSEGFTVETDSAEVIDLGTVFSVGAEETGTKVVVFDGEVDLKYVDPIGGVGNSIKTTTKRFQAGEAVYVSQDGTLSRIVNVNQAEFSSGDSRSGTAPLIKAVRDNISRDDMWSFYEIVPSGLKEDAKAFVDRKHEWNGVTIDGMPPYLLGADYVKTFADDKVTSNLTIDLELQEPAVVYVFLDKRVAIPEWLVERFQDTGDEIGIDESYPSRHFPNKYRDAQVGAGEGIRQVFSVWKLVAEEGVVHLGPNGAIPPEEQLRGVNAESLMYGIAAIRLDQAGRTAF